ncbi:MAG: nucleotide exchange factor GrpE, partial [Nitrospirota bacterium]
MKKHNDKPHEGRKVPIEEGYKIEEEGKEEAMGQAGMPEEAVADQKALSAEVKKIRDDLEKTKAELHDSKDRYLRLYAETENFKKRMSREAVEQGKYANESLIKEIIPVLDNLERAISHADGAQGGQCGHSGQGNEALVEGVKMVAKQFMDILTKFGVTQVESIG